MTVSETMVLTGAKALHEEWRASILPGGTNHSMRGIIKDETLFSWENLHPENRESYLRTSRTALTAALSDQVVVAKEPVAFRWRYKADQISGRPATPWNVRVGPIKDDASGILEIEPLYAPASTSGEVGK